MLFAPTCTIRAPHSLAARAGVVGGAVGGVVLVVFLAITASIGSPVAIVVTLLAAALAGVPLALAGNATGLVGCAGKALGTGALYGAGIWALVQLLLIPALTHGTIGEVTQATITLFNGYVLAGAAAGMGISVWLARAA